jgi:hypothetical protein
MEGEFPSRPADRPLRRKNIYRLPYILLPPPDDGLQMGPKYVQALQFNKAKKNSVSCWLVI